MYICRAPITISELPTLLHRLYTHFLAIDHGQFATNPIVNFRQLGSYTLIEITFIHTLYKDHRPEFRNICLPVYFIVYSVYAITCFFRQSLTPG